MTGKTARLQSMTTAPKFKVMKACLAQRHGYPIDRRKRRRLHRAAAKCLIAGGTLLNGRAPVGSTPWLAAQWHLFQARHL